MDKSFKIAGIVVATWIALGLVGWIFDFLANWFFWVAVVAGGVWVAAAISGHTRTLIGGLNIMGRNQ